MVDRKLGQSRDGPNVLWDRDSAGRRLRDFRDSDVGRTNSTHGYRRWACGVDSRVIAERRIFSRSLMES